MSIAKKMNKVKKQKDLSQLSSGQLHRIASASALCRSKSAMSISRESHKLSQSELNVRVVASKLMKQFSSERTFSKDEALKFVHTVVRQTKLGSSHGMLGFDAVFKSMKNKEGRIDYSSMPGLCLKVFEFGSKSEKSSHPSNTAEQYNQLKLMIKAANSPEGVKKAVEELLRLFDPKQTGILENG
jgi:hypothetical protein